MHGTGNRQLLRFKVVHVDGTESRNTIESSQRPTRDEIEGLITPYLSGTPLHVVLHDRGRDYDAFMSQTARIDGQPVNVRATEMFSADAIAQGATLDPDKKIHGPVVIFDQRIKIDENA